MVLAYTVCINKVLKRGIPTLRSETVEAGLLKRVYEDAFPEIAGVSIEIHELADGKSGAAKCFTKIINASCKPIRISRADAGIAAENSGAELHYFSSNWGREYDPLSMLLTETHSIQVLSGRSGKGYAPWVGLDCGEGYYSLNVGWSGNWQASTFRRVLGDPKLFVMMGIYEGDFFIDIDPGKEFCGADVYISFAKENLEKACCKTRQYFRDYVSLIDRDKWETLPLSYNTWWCYEDQIVNEEKCIQNAVISKELGLTNFLMDAGWFGNNENGINWYQKRGDWNIENRDDFPHGIQYLGQAVNGAGVKFGIWCEIEAVGEKAELNDTHPELIATRDGRNLGYVCMGNPKTVDWAVGVIDRLVQEYGANWIKFDFNLDPNQGCNCTAHGHGEGDGLYAHYMGYYRFLDILHQKYPDLVLEDCCSGGLRMDFGLLSKSHFTFLSDPDYVDNHFQAFWGATSCIHPIGCYHFTQSQSLGGINGAAEPKNPISEDMSQAKFDYYMRSAMMSTVGFSYDFPSWPQWCLDRLKEHVKFFKQMSKKYIMCGEMYRLTGQALRYGKGDRFQGYQFNAEDKTAYVFAFKLKGAVGDRTLHLEGLDESRTYQVRMVDAQKTWTASGAELMKDGIALCGMEEESSELIELQ